MAMSNSPLSKALDKVLGIQARSRSSDEIVDDLVERLSGARHDVRIQSIVTAMQKFPAKLNGLVAVEPDAGAGYTAYIACLKARASANPNPRENAPALSDYLLGVADLLGEPTGESDRIHENGRSGMFALGWEAAQDMYFEAAGFGPGEIVSILGRETIDETRAILAARLGPDFRSKIRWGSL